MKIAINKETRKKKKEMSDLFLSKKHHLNCQLFKWCLILMRPNLTNQKANQKSIYCRFFHEL